MNSNQDATYIVDARRLGYECVLGKGPDMYDYYRDYGWEYLKAYMEGKSKGKKGKAKGGKDEQPKGKGRLRAREQTHGGRGDSRTDVSDA